VDNRQLDYKKKVYLLSKEEFDVSKLSPKAQIKLEEVRKQHNLKTLAEAASYMLDFTKRK
jgi:hypothetical protein